MIEKSSFIDSLNSIGIAAYLLMIWGASSILKWILKLIAKFSFSKAKEEATKMISEDIAERIGEKLMTKYIEAMRAEANFILNPLKKSLKSLAKSNRENQKRIAQIEKSLNEHRASEHKYRNDTLTVLNFLVDSTIQATDESTKKIKELRNKVSDEIKNNPCEIICN